MIYNTPYLDAFHNLEASLRAKRYILLLSTEGTGPFEVCAGEIIRVDPTLKDNSFVGDQVRIFSSTKFKTIEKKWIELPLSSSQTVKDSHADVMDMLDKKFETMGEVAVADQHRQRGLRGMSGEATNDRRRDLKRRLRWIDDLKRAGEATWTPEEQALVESEEIIRSLGVH